MKALRPLTIVALGPPLLGIAFSLGTWVAMPRSQDLASLAWSFAIGAAAGLVMFGPIAAILALGERYPEWLARHSSRIGFYSSFAMAFSIGYGAACMRHSVSDNLMLAAFATVFLGATVKTALSYALARYSKEPSTCDLLV
jgi:hypothetical protein